MDLYTRIVKALPKKLWVSPESREICAINIYLTAMGARPACIPFDGEIKHDGMPSSEMFEYIQAHPKLLNKLRDIPEITVLEGPYYDNGDKFVVANTAQLPKTQKQLDTIVKAREVMERDGTDVPGELHIAMGTMLGYTCPMDLDEVLSLKNEDRKVSLYQIEFYVDGLEIDMIVWCPKDKNYLGEPGFSKVVWNQLDAMNEVLKPIGKKAELRVTHASVW